MQGWIGVKDFRLKLLNSSSSRPSWTKYVELEDLFMKFPKFPLLLTCAEREDDLGEEDAEDAEEEEDELLVVFNHSEASFRPPQRKSSS